MILQSGITLYLNPVLCVVIYRKNVAWVYFYNCKLLLYPSQSYLSLYPPKLGVSDSCNSFSVSVVSCSTLMPKSHIGRSSADPTRLIFPRWPKMIGRQLIGSDVTVTLERFGSDACQMCGDIHRQTNLAHVGLQSAWRMFWFTLLMYVIRTYMT